MGNDILGVLADEKVTGGAIVLGCSIGSKIALMLAAIIRRYSGRPFWSAATAGRSRSSITALPPIAHITPPARWRTITFRTSATA